jgi:hypothetical protein
MLLSCSGLNTGVVHGAEAPRSFGRPDRDGVPEGGARLFHPSIGLPNQINGRPQLSCQARAVYTQLPEMMWGSCYAFSPNSVSDIRYTSDSNGQGVHEGAPVSNEPFSWVGAGRDQHSANILLLEERQPMSLGDSNCSSSCMEWQALHGSSGSQLTALVC